MLEAVEKTAVSLQEASRWDSEYFTIDTAPRESVLNLSDRPYVEAVSFVALPEEPSIARRINGERDNTFHIQDSFASFMEEEWETIPGNRHSGHPTGKLIFQHLLPLEAEEREGQLHRESDTAGGGFCREHPPQTGEPRVTLCVALERSCHIIN